MAIVCTTTRPPPPTYTPAAWRESVATAVAALTDVERGNLAWHIDQQTPLVCGEQWRAFIGPDGAA